MKDFCDYFEINSHTIYDKVIHRKKEITLIMKELDNLTSLKFLLLDEKTGNFKFVNLFLEGGFTVSFVELKVNKDLTTKYYLDLKKDYTNVYLRNYLYIWIQNLKKSQNFKFIIKLQLF